MKYSRSLSMAVSLAAVGFFGCASSSDGGGSGGSNSTGGSHSGGHTGSGGAPGTGGKATGGSPGTGGSGSGGTATGGSGSGGASSGSGGKATGGSSGNNDAGTGGSATGGSSGNSGSGAGGAATGGSSGGAGTGGAATGGSSGSGGSTGNCSASSDTCPAPGAGVTINCKKRFMYGVNYAWASFAGDFGGISKWSQQGVAGAKAARTTDLTEMKNNGVDVVRWWMYPDIGGDGVKLDSSKTPTGLGGTVVDDINAALDIAATLDIHIKLTLFSFDSFWNEFTDSGITFPSLQPIATDDTKRAALIANVVVPIAKAVEASPNKDRMIAWDVINEPEWSITGQDPYGDQAFDPTSSGSNGKTMSTVTFAQMETFVKDIVTALHANSKAPVTVGSAAVKWAKAWSQVGLDFNDFHWYGWVDQYFAHTKTPTEYKVDDKQTVVGEFPLIPASDTTGQSFGGLSYGKLVDDFQTAGYAGVQGWAFSDTSAAFNWSSAKANVKAWADAHTCYTHY